MHELLCSTVFAVEYLCMLDGLGMWRVWLRRGGV